MKLLLSVIRLALNMGPRYFLFRSWYEAARRSGLLRLRFPKQTVTLQFTSVACWRQSPVRFFFNSKETLSRRYASSGLFQERLPTPPIPSGTDWLTNPQNNYCYPGDRHWTLFPDFSETAGDIKLVWEKSRFTFLYALIRQDFHQHKDHADLVLHALTDWISTNPVNCGPNWKCSQEIALRVLNWTFALHYYRHTPALTEQRFQVILNSIYRQMQHVEANIQFSRLAVRNNHILTEALGLYLTGLLFPFFPESARWLRKGKRWFEQEIAFQLNDEGAFIQHSLNYHRVVVQLLAWGLRLAHVNGAKWSDRLYERAHRTLSFLHSFQDPVSGHLPNYGNNDGALFFPLTSCHFRDFRPQLAALAAVLGRQLSFAPGKWQEELFWLQLDTSGTPILPPTAAAGYTASGYFVLKEPATLTFTRCARYTQRPFQSDNLHTDLWFNGDNLLRDAGTYQYHTDALFRRYFAGCEGHNTVSVGPYDQMQQGRRFIWYYWVRQAAGQWFENEHEWVFEGSFTGYRHLSRKGIRHFRQIRKSKTAPGWVITDRVSELPHGLPLRQIWHPSDAFSQTFAMEAHTPDGEAILPQVLQGWFSDAYATKAAAPYWVFATQQTELQTRIFRRT